MDVRDTRDRGQTGDELRRPRRHEPPQTDTNRGHAGSSPHQNPRRRSTIRLRAAADVTRRSGAQNAGEKYS
jgi:hypothetical protein